jgi:hypothetical protein
VNDESRKSLIGLQEVLRQLRAEYLEMTGLRLNAAVHTGAYRRRFFGGEILPALHREPEDIYGHDTKLDGALERREILK